MDFIGYFLFFYSNESNRHLSDTFSDLSGSAETYNKEGWLVKHDIQDLRIANKINP